MKEVFHKEPIIMRACQSCNNPLANNARSCPKCGWRVPTKNISPVVYVPVILLVTILMFWVFAVNLKP